MTRVDHPIYLDNNSTTALDPRVLDAMLPYYREHYGNAASSAHRFGWAAQDAVEQARERVAGALNATSREIVWTSGATESNNLAIQGVAGMYGDKGRHIITQATEHPAVLDPCQFLQRAGFRVTTLPVDERGMIDIQQLQDAMTPDTILVSIMYANNELGTIQPITEIGRLCKQRGVWFHCDATQAFCKLPVDVQTEGVDLLSISGHKIYGPKGVGALFVRRRRPRVRLQAMIHGGGHENELRSGTLNVPGIVGLGMAAEIGAAQLQEEAGRHTGLRDRLFDGLAGRMQGVQLNGHPTARLCNTANISFDNVDAESLMTGIAPIAVSTGSACSSATKAHSHVLKAIGADEQRIRSAIRFSLGRFNTQEDIDLTIEAVCRCAGKLRKAHATTIA